jgi:hypothetical protein
MAAVLLFHNIGLACRVLTTWLRTRVRDRPRPARSPRDQASVDEILSRMPTALATPSSVHSSSETAQARRR